MKPSSHRNISLTEKLPSGIATYSVNYARYDTYIPLRRLIPDNTYEIVFLKQF